MNNFTIFSLEDIACVASVIDQEFDFVDSVPAEVEQEVREEYGDAFYEEFIGYLNMSLYAAIGETIKEFIVTEGVQQVINASKISLANTVSWHGEELEG